MDEALKLEVTQLVYTPLQLVMILPKVRSWFKVWVGLMRHMPHADKTNICSACIHAYICL